MGHLTHALKTRHDIRRHYSHLSGKGVAPTVGDEIKAIYALRYLYSTPEVMCVYSAKSPVLCAYSDSAFAVHEQGTSSTALILCMSPTDAPFVCSAKAQSAVAPDIVAGEYYSAGSTCLLLSHFRQLAAQLGWIQGPTVVYMDSKSAINLACAPAITKKARHMKAKYYYIRQMVAAGEVSLVHIPAESMRVDMLSKIVSPSKFLTGRDSLMNLGAVGVSS